MEDMFEGANTLNYSDENKDKKIYKYSLFLEGTEVKLFLAQLMLIHGITSKKNLMEMLMLIVRHWIMMKFRKIIV